jgi:hypothetical protein
MSRRLLHDRFGLCCIGGAGFDEFDRFDRFDLSTEWTTIVLATTPSVTNS